MKHKWGTSINRVKFYNNRAFLAGKSRGKFIRRYGIVKKCANCKKDFFVLDTNIKKGFNSNYCWRCFSVIHAIECLKRNLNYLTQEAHYEY